MDIYKVAKNILLIYLVGGLVYTLHFLINEVPSPDIKGDFGTSMLIGVFVVLTASLVRPFLRKLPDNLATFSSIFLVSMTLLVIGKIFPIGIDYVKVYKADDIKNLSIEDLMRKQGEELILIEHEGHYTLVKNRKDFSWIGKSFVDDMGNILKIEDANVVLVRNFDKKYKNSLNYILSVTGIFLVLYLANEFIERRKFDKQT